MKTLTIGELARLTRLNAETLRYYERRGLLPAPARKASGYRQYGPDDVARVRAIREAQRLGFTLREIVALLSFMSRTRPSCASLVRHARRKMADLERKIRELEEAKAALQTLVDRCTWQPGSKRKCALAGELSLAGTANGKNH
jgi:DNA-binding transcriptional MerR regulator